jgi:hypothetical protein
MINPTWGNSFKSQPKSRYILKIHRGVAGAYLGEGLHGEARERRWPEEEIAGRWCKGRERWWR